MLVLQALATRLLEETTAATTCLKEMVVRLKTTVELSETTEARLETELQIAVLQTEVLLLVPLPLAVLSAQEVLVVVRSVAHVAMAVVRSVVLAAMAALHTAMVEASVATDNSSKRNK